MDSFRKSRIERGHTPLALVSCHPYEPIEIHQETVYSNGERFWVIAWQDYAGVLRVTDYNRFNLVLWQAGVPIPVYVSEREHHLIQACSSTAKSPTVVNKAWNGAEAAEHVLRLLLKCAASRELIDSELVDLCRQRLASGAYLTSPENFKVGYSNLFSQVGEDKLLSELTERDKSMVPPYISHTVFERLWPGLQNLLRRLTVYDFGILVTLQNSPFFNESRLYTTERIGFKVANLLDDEDDCEEQITAEGLVGEEDINPPRGAFGAWRKRLSSLSVVTWFYIILMVLAVILRIIDAILGAPMSAVPLPVTAHLAVIGALGAGAFLLARVGWLSMDSRPDLTQYSDFEELDHADGR